jgi:hypothetical protein
MAQGFSTASSPPTNNTSPTITGTPTDGQQLQEQHGSWTNSPTSFSSQWRRCDAAGASCQDIAGQTAQSYTLTSADVGHTIRVKEIASNAGGDSQAVSSLATGLVQAASSGGGGNGGGTGSGDSGGSSTGAGGSGSSTQTPPPSGGPGPTVTAAQVLQALVSQLLPPKAATKIKALLKAGGLSGSFTAPTPGKLVLQWFFLPRGAHLAKAKPVLVASGAQTFAAAGKGKVALKLTAAGKKLLKKSKKLKLSAKGVFTPQGGKVVSSAKTFAVGR